MCPLERFLGRLEVPIAVCIILPGLLGNHDLQNLPFQQKFCNTSCLDTQDRGANRTNPYKKETEVAYCKDRYIIVRKDSVRVQCSAANFKVFHLGLTSNFKTGPHSNGGTTTV